MTAEHRRFARRPGVLPELRSKKGRATIQMPWPIPSVMSPRARVSDMPSAHLLRLLKLAPPTMIASAIGSAYAAPGFLYWWRAGNPVYPSRAGSFVDELQRRRSRNDTDTPTAFLCQTHQLAYVASRWCGAGACLRY